MHSLATDKTAIFDSNKFSARTRASQQDRRGLGQSAWERRRQVMRCLYK